MNGNDSTSQWSTPDEVAAELKVPVDLVQKLIAEKRLAAVRVGDVVRIRTSALERYLERAGTARSRWALGVRAGVGVAAAAAVMGAVMAATNPPLSGEVVPRQIPYRGVLTENSSAVTGMLPMKFELFRSADAAQGEVSLWADSPTVAVQDGWFNVALGDASANPIPDTVFSQPSLYLQVTVNGQQLAGRQRLLTVPYAQKANTSTNVAGGGTVSAATASATTVNATNVNTGTVNAAGDVAGAALSAGGVRIGSGAPWDMIAGGNGAGNLHIESNLNNGGDGRIYLNWSNGKGVVVGSGGLAVSGNIDAAGATIKGNATITGVLAGRVVGGVILHLNTVSTAAQGGGCSPWGAGFCASVIDLNPTCTNGGIHLVSHGNCYSGGAGYCRHYLCIQGL